MKQYEVTCPLFQTVNIYILICKYTFESTMLFDSTLPDLQDDFQEFTPVIKNGIAYFSCAKRMGVNAWEDSEIGIPAKIWWRFLYKPKSTFVTYRMVS